MKRRTLLMVGLPGVLVAALLVHGLLARQHSLAALTRVANEQALVPVQIVSPQKGPSTRPLMLPGTLRAWYEAPIYAQVAGYVQSWDADFGANVKAGQPLAMIDTPSLDAQYAAAKANLSVAQANYRLAVSTAARWQALAVVVFTLRTRSTAVPAQRRNRGHRPLAPAPSGRSEGPSPSARRRSVLRAALL